MKKLVLVMAISLMGSVMFAQEAANQKFVVVGQSNPGIYKVIYDNPGESKVKMNIYRSNGEKVFTQTVNVEGFVRTVNLKGMYQDKYTIEVTDSQGKYAQVVDYASQSATNIHVARLDKESNKYLLSVANTAGETPSEVNVRILDGENNVVHTQSLAVNGSVGLVYDLGQVHGAPTFEVADNSGTYRTIRY